MTKRLLSSLLDDGVAVRHRRNDAVVGVYDQVKRYFRHGIEAPHRGTVFDVGANIGLFTLYVNQATGGTANIYAFEPIPETYAVLEDNVKALDNMNVLAINSGLSSDNRTSKFAYFPLAPVLSMDADHDWRELMDQLENAILRNLDQSAAARRFRIRLVPPFLRRWVWHVRLKRKFKPKFVSCRLGRLSNYITEYDIATIDLLKIDVEKSEMDVLRGIDPGHWSKIRQVVMEIHDVDGRVDEVQTLLGHAGFGYVKIDQDDLLRGSNIVNLYARRASRGDP